MLKKTVTYKDWNGETHTDDLWFNIRKDEIIENWEIQARMERVKKFSEGEKRELSMEEVAFVLALVKDVMKLGYGIRSEDGKKHSKAKGAHWDDFVETAAYEAFIEILFQNNAVEANEFLIGMFPEGLMEEARRELEARGDMANGTAPEDKPMRAEDYSRQELLDMSQEEFDRLAGKDPSKMAPSVLQVAYQRKASA